MKFWIENPGRTTARAVYLLDDEAAPEGATVLDDEEYEPRQVVSNHIASAYSRPGVCSFCGGPTPCLRED